MKAEMKGRLWWACVRRLALCPNEEEHKKREIERGGVGQIATERYVVAAGAGFNLHLNTSRFDDDTTRDLTLILHVNVMSVRGVTARTRRAVCCFCIGAR